MQPLTLKMLRFLIVLFACANSYVTANVVPRQVVSFVEHELIPDVLESPPADILKMTFPNNVEMLEGNVLTISEVAGTPVVEWNYKPGHFYTLVMADADPPSRVNPEARSFLQWLVINIPEGDVNSGQTITQRLHSNPEPNTGLHRYYFLVYEQKGFIDELEPESSFEKHAAFKPDEFAKKNNIELIAGNFYQTENLGE